MSFRIVNNATRVAPQVSESLIMLGRYVVGKAGGKGEEAEAEHQCHRCLELFKPPVLNQGLG